MAFHVNLGGNGAYPVTATASANINNDYSADQAEITITVTGTFDKNTYTQSSGAMFYSSCDGQNQGPTSFIGNTNGGAQHLYPNAYSASHIYLVAKAASDRQISWSVNVHASYDMADKGDAGTESGVLTVSGNNPLQLFYVQTYDPDNMEVEKATFSLSHDAGASWTDELRNEDPLATQPYFTAGTEHWIKNIVPDEGWYLDPERGVSVGDNAADPTGATRIYPDADGIYKATQPAGTLVVNIFVTQNPKYYFDVSIIDDKGVERHGQDEGEHASIATVTQSNNGGESWEEPQSNEWPWGYWPIGTQHWLKDFTPVEGWYLKSVVLAVMDTEFSESNGTKLKPDKDGIYKIPQEAYQMSVRFFCVQGGTKPQDVYIGTDGTVYARRYVTQETDHVEITPDGEVYATAFTEGESFGISLGEVMAKAFRIGTPE